MEHLKQTSTQISNKVWWVSATVQAVAGMCGLGLYALGLLPAAVTIMLVAIVGLAGGYFASRYAGRLATIPLEALGNTILHLAPDQEPQTTLKSKDIAIGHEFVNAVAFQLYQVASLQDNKILAEHRREATQASNILKHLPLPILVFNKQQTVTFASDAALTYFGQQSTSLFGKHISEGVSLEFPGELSLEKWVDDCTKNKITDTAYWRRVRVRLKDGSETVRQGDIAGYYHRDNPAGIEFIITLFDRTQEYTQEEQSLSFIALAVHELRTPLTLMRGLIEVFEDELQGKLDTEMATFMQRLHGSAQQLTAYVSNILNVAKIEEGQLPVKLTEEIWTNVIAKATTDMSARAESLGIRITTDIAHDLPTVAADPLMAYEVICNLLDNAIKYGGDSHEISLVATIDDAGLVETVVSDKGLGVPTSVLPTVFDKFQRNHRNQQDIAGTGLGLYLSKAIVNAHGGDIWIKSKENQGTSVGFTLKPYSMLADEQKNGNNKNSMVHTRHGWIKNHSLYRS